MDMETMLKKISEKSGKTVEEIKNEAKLKKAGLNGMVSDEGAVMIVGSFYGVDFSNKTSDVDIDIEEDDSRIGSQNGEEELSLDDLGKKYIKSPAVGESIEFVLKKIKKSTNVDAVTKDGKKFSTALTSVNYKMIYQTSNDEEFSPKSWEVVGKINAICRKLKKIDGIKLKVTHIKDGMKDKEGDNYNVQAEVDGAFKQLDRKTSDWK